MATETSNKSITSLLDKMVAADTDYRFMAINDLTTELQVDTLRLDFQNEKKVVGLILGLLRDPNGEVQSLAVKSLGPLILKVKDQHIITIIKDLVVTMERGGEGQLRSICSIGLKTVVNALPNVKDKSVIRVAIREAISPLMQMVVSHHDVNLRVEACEILGEMITHFGSLLTDHHLDLLDCMLTCLGCSQTTLRKRAIQAIGSLSWTMRQKYFASLVHFLLFRLKTSPVLKPHSKELCGEELSKLVQEHVLFQRPHILEQLKQCPSDDVTKALLQCFNVVARQLQRVNHCTISVLQLLTFILRQTDCDYSDQDDIHELVIQICETLIRHCPHILSGSLNEVIILLCERLQYDPNYNHAMDEDGSDQMMVDNGDMDYEDDEDDAEYSDDEDMSWKVRRAAARAIEAIIVVYFEKTADFYVTIAPLLIKRFNEREESVRLAIFSCLRTLLKQTCLISMNPNVNNSNSCVTSQPLNHRLSDSTIFVSESLFEQLRQQLNDPNSAQSRLLSLLPTLYQAIDKQTSQLSGTKNKGSHSANRTVSNYRHMAFMLNRDLALALPGQLGLYLNKVFEMIRIIADDANANHTMKMEMMNVLVLLVSTHPAHYFEQKMDVLVQLTVNAIKDPFYRVVLEGLDLFQILCTQLKPLINVIYAEHLFIPLYDQLQATDRDLELKEKAITTVAVLIAQIGDLILPRLNDCLNMIGFRLTSESTRLCTVRAIQIIASSKLDLDATEFMRTASEQLASFLIKNDRTLRIATLKCLYVVWLKFPNCIGHNCLNTVFNLMPKLLITEHDLQTTQLALYLMSLLLESDDSSLSNLLPQFIVHDNFLQPLISLAHSPLLRGQALEAMLHLMRVVGTMHKTNQTKQPAMAKLMLQYLLSPFEQVNLFGAQTNLNHSVGELHRDALPSLAQCVAVLLAQFPMFADAATGSDNLNYVIDQLLMIVKDPNSSPVQVYLNMLVFGELGRKVDLSNRTDVWDVLISCLSSAQTNTNDASDAAYTTTTTISNNDNSKGPIITEEAKPAIALSLGRLVAGSPQNLLTLLIEQISNAITQTQSVQINPAQTNLACPDVTFDSASYRKQAANQHRIYHLLQALKEVLINLTYSDPTGSLRTHLQSMWSLMILSAGSSEEGTRNLVAESLGRLTLISPSELINRLRNQLNSPETSSNVLIRCTLVSAVKFLLIVSDIDAATQTRFINSSRLDPVDFNHTNQTMSFGTYKSTNAAITNEVESILRSGKPPLLLDFLGRLADDELPVKRAALVTLNTVAHHKPALIRPLLNQPITLYNPNETATLLDFLYAETVIRKELIREVQMGPFKHHEDDGLDLRKCAFECMSTLLETCLDKLVISKFIESLVDGLRDHTEIKLLSYQILQHITYVRPLEILAKMEAMSAPLKTVLLSKPKDDLVKQEVEKMRELNRSALSLIGGFRNIEDIDKNHHYMELMRIIEADSLFKSIYSQCISSDVNTTGLTAVNGNNFWTNYTTTTKRR